MIKNNKTAKKNPETQIDETQTILETENNIKGIVYDDNIHIRDYTFRGIGYYMRYYNDVSNESSLITVEHRSGNKKRDFLFVNKGMCKHIPSSPKKMVEMCKNLANQLNKWINQETRTLVIGFAETATAIGEFTAENIATAVLYAQTTREDSIGNIVKVNTIEFKEEHSHAPQQLLSTLDSIDTLIEKYNIETIVFIDDEITTGNTILNIVKKLKELIKQDNFEKIHFVVGSICNWQSDDDKEKFKEYSIRAISLVWGNMEERKMNIEVDDKKDEVENKGIVINMDFRGVCEDSTQSQFLQTRLERELTSIIHIGMYKKIVNIVACILDNSYIKTEDKKTSDKRGLKYRIIGTEEFMTLPIRVGEILENMGNEVISHSTTRTKIDIMKETLTYKDIDVNYIEESTQTCIMNRLELTSAYDKNRVTYLYNLDDSADITVIMTDSPNDEAVSIFVNTLLINISNLSKKFIVIRV